MTKSLLSAYGSVKTPGFDFSRRNVAGAFRPAHRVTGTLQFPRWLGAVTPTFVWSWPHLEYVQRALHEVTVGKVRRLMVFMPPRHGKSEMVTVRYPVYRLELDPSLRVIIGAYNQTFAEKFGRKSRAVAREVLTMNRERQAAADWETHMGGGVRSVGVGAGVTGQGGNLIIIDDPVKSRLEASSPAYRQRCWDWYKDDLYTRLEPNAAMILIQTRWHEDDLAGRILDSEEGPEWRVVSLPALAEERDPLGRAVGQALCPQRYDEPALARIQRVLGPWSFAALYQQRPMPFEGAMFKRPWFNTVPVAPRVARRVRYWDKAASTKRGSDWSSTVRMAVSDGRFYVEHVLRGQWSSHDRNSVQRQLAASDAAEFDGEVSTWIEQEGGSGGKESAEISLTNLAGFAVRVETVSGSKETRAQPFADQAQGGNVFLVAGPWNSAYLDELCSFPFGANDDQVDASSGAFNKLAVGRGGVGFVL